MAVVKQVPKTLRQLGGAEHAQEWAAQNGLWLKKVLDSHITWLNEFGIANLQAAYDGKLEKIDTRDRAKGDDVNKKLMASYAQLVIDTVVDYLTGKPFTWTVETPEENEATGLADEYRQAIVNLLQKGESQRVLAEQLRQGGIAGYSGVISWVDENGKIDYEEYPVQEVVLVYDTKGRLRYVIRYYNVVDETETGVVNMTKVEVYDEQYVTYLETEEDGSSFRLDPDEVETGNPVEHKAGRIPVSVFTNGMPAQYEKRVRRAGTSDLDNGVLSLIEEYADMMSDKGNSATYMLDQYLLLKGVTTDEDEVLSMRKARALQLKGENSNASFIAPNQDDKAVNNHLTRLKDDIQGIGAIPKLDSLSGATATEIKVKYAALDIRANKKELYFQPAILQLVTILTDMLNAERLHAAGVTNVYDVLAGNAETKVPLYNADWLAVTINRNQPQNYLEIAQVVKTLSGMVPDSYLYELLWFVEDPVAALDEMKAQKVADAQAALAAVYPPGFSNTNPPNSGGGGGA